MPAPSDQEVSQHHIVFYDGSCGLCHRFVRFLLWRDSARQFYYSPLRGELIGRLVEPGVRAGLPDSIVLRTPDGSLRTRSEAVLESLARLGGIWSLTSRIGRVLPQRLRDAMYDFIARVRRKIFRVPESVCPVVPAEMRERFVD